MKAETTMRKQILAIASALALFLAGPGSAQVANPPAAVGAYGPPTSLYPYVGGLTGSYTIAMNTGIIAAGLASNSPIFSLRYGGTGTAVVKSVRITAGTIVGFAANGLCRFNLFPARAFTASDTGGTSATLTGNNAKMRTSFATTAMANIQVASTGTMTAGTRTLDAQPIGNADLTGPATGGATISAGNNLLYAQNAGDYPLVLAPNEGVVLQATVPATGTWWITVVVEWDEYANSY